MSSIRYYINTVILKLKSYQYRRVYNASKNLKLREKYRVNNQGLYNQYKQQISTFQFIADFISFNHSQTEALYHEHLNNYERSPENPIHQTILALLSFNLYNKDPSTTKLDTFYSHINKLQAIIKTINGNQAFIYPIPDHTYTLEPGWSSAICQALASSAFLRVYYLTQNHTYLQKARSCLDLVLNPENKLLIKGPHSGLWAEEYPSNPPSYVLNGCIFFIIAVIEYEALSGNNIGSDKWIKSLFANMHLFQYKKHLLYDQLHRPFANVLYQKIHRHQMLHLRKLTGFQGFNELIPRH